MASDKADLFANAWALLVSSQSRPFLPPEREFRFLTSRRWRFDFAWPSRFVAVEVDGNAWHVRGGGRHMQDADLEKYNEAACKGWRVLRFSPQQLERDPAGCVDLIRQALREEARNAA